MFGLMLLERFIKKQLMVPDKSGYHIKIFLISPQKGASNEYHNIRFCGEIKKKRY